MTSPVILIYFKAEAERIKKIIETLREDGGDLYIKLQQVLSFMNVDKTVIVPTDSILFVPIGDLDKSKNLPDIIEEQS